jgi:dUTPase
MQDINFRHIAIQIGNDLKYSTSVNEIDRIGQCQFQKTNPTAMNISSLLASLSQQQG